MRHETRLLIVARPHANIQVRRMTTRDVRPSSEYSAWAKVTSSTRVYEGYQERSIVYNFIRIKGCSSQEDCVVRPSGERRRAHVRSRVQLTSYEEAAAFSLDSSNRSAMSPDVKNITKLDYSLLVIPRILQA